MDIDNGKVYALFRKNGYYNLKRINLSTGSIESSFKLNFPYVDNIKVKDDYVYYIYRPFESLQQRFIYRELIHD